MTPGTLVIGFGDPAVNFANGKVSGSDYINPKGFEVDLANPIAKDLGLTPKYVFTPWEKLFAPGAQVVRHLVPGSDDHRAAEEDGRLHVVVLRREPGRAAVEEGSRRRTRSPT